MTQEPKEEKPFSMWEIITEDDELLRDALRFVERTRDQLELSEQFRGTDTSVVNAVIVAQSIVFAALKIVSEIRDVRFDMSGLVETMAELNRDD